MSYEITFNRYTYIEVYKGKKNRVQNVIDFRYPLPSVLYVRREPRAKDSNKKQRF